MDRLGADKKDAIETFALLAEATGVDIRLIAQKSDQKGNVKGYQGLYNKKGNYIEIDINAGLNNIFKDLHTGMTAVLGHELTHWMQENAPTEYLAYKKAVLQAIMSTKNGELRLERMIDAQINQNKREGKEITRSEAEDEVVADASMKRMGDTEFWNAVADNLGEKKADVAARIRDYISKFFQRVRELLRKASHTSEAARIVDQTEADVQANLRKLYAALTGAAMRNSAQTGSETAYKSAEENEAILSLVQKVKSGDYKKSDIVSLGIIDENNAKAIKEITGIDATGYEVKIEPRMIDHILNDHGENGKSDRSMANPADIARMEYAINNAESIIDGGTTSAYVSFVNGKNRPAKTVLYETPIGAKSYYVVEAVPDNAKRTLFIVSAFIGQKGYKKGASQFTDAKGSGATSKNAAATTPISRITQEAPSVKPSDEILSTRSDADSTGRELTGAAMRNSAQTGTETKNAATEGGKQFATRENGDDVQHTIQDAKEQGIIKKENFARFYEAIAEIKKLKYNSFIQTANGEYVIDDGNVIMFAGGTFMNPVMTRAIVLNDNSETNMADAKERIYEEVSRTGRYHESARFIELVYGEGYAALYTNPAFGSDGRKNQRGERSPGKRNTGTTEKGKVKYATRSDTDYLDAVERGDMETAQRMVDEAAKEAGYVLSAYHGTAEDFNVFRRGEEGIHLGDVLQARQRAKISSERAERTDYKWKNLRSRVWELGTESRETIVRLARNNVMWYGNVSEEPKYFDGDINSAADVVKYVDDMAQLLDKDARESLSMVLSTFDRDVDPKVLDLYAKIKKPLKVNSDILVWTPAEIARMLKAKSSGLAKKFQKAYTDTYIDVSGSDISLTKKEADTLDKVSEFEIMRDDAWNIIADVLSAHGYDGIQYVNQYEGDRNSPSYIALRPSDVKRAAPVTYDDNDNIIPLSERFDPGEKDIRYSTRPTTDSTGRELSEGQQAYFKDSRARDINGKLLVLYHQTENDFTVFDPRHEGAGTRDQQTPFGIFLKSSDRDIGVKGKKQMALYANITKPLVALNRESLESKLRDLFPEYAKLSDQHKALDREYKQKHEQAKQAFTDYLTTWREQHPNAGRSEIYKDADFDRLWNAEDDIIDEWEQKARELETETKEVLTNALEAAGYDGIFLGNDTGSWGRSTDAYIALHPEQVKNVDNLNPTENPDIRYATRDYSDVSDLDLLLNAANEISEGGGEDYWASLLESNPGLAGEAEEIKRLGKQLRDTEAKLAEARRNLTLTDRKLRTRGISTLAATIMQNQKAGDINKKDVKSRITAALTEAYQKALDQLDAGADVGTAWDTVYNEGVVKAADILLSDATYSEKHGYEWVKTTLGQYLGEGAREYAVRNRFPCFSLKRGGTG